MRPGEIVTITTPSGSIYRALVYETRINRTRFDEIEGEIRLRIYAGTISEKRPQKTLEESVAIETEAEIIQERKLLQ